MIYKDVIEAYAQKRKISLRRSYQLHEKLEVFLNEALISNKPLSPTKEIDGAWHNFILNTKRYNEYCNSQLGKFIHHIPMKSGKGLADCGSSCATGD